MLLITAPRAAAGYDRPGIAYRRSPTRLDYYLPRANGPTSPRAFDASVPSRSDDAEGDRRGHRYHPGARPGASGRLLFG